MERHLAVRAIPAAATVDLRWAVLRPGFPRETALFAGDEAAGTLHFGVYANDQLVGVASLYEAEEPGNPPSAGARQLRGMATLPEVRGSGCGRALLESCVAAAERADCPL